MNLILNREINGFSLSDQVRIIAAMNPEDSFDYQTIDMDPAQWAQHELQALPEDFRFRIAPKLDKAATHETTKLRMQL